MYAHDCQVRVRYAETDQMGYLYYGNYAQFYEVGRVETMRSIGLTYKELEEVHGIWLPVVSLESRFIRPAYYDELLTLHTEIRHLPNQYITFYTDIYNEKGKLLNAGRVRLCFLDSAAKKPIIAPDILLQHLRDYFSA